MFTKKQISMATKKTIKKPAAKKAAPAKKAVKPAPKKPVAKKAVPAKKVVKPAPKKPVVKKAAPAKKVVPAKKAVKPVAKKVVAKKVAPVKKAVKPAPKKPEAKKAVPAKKIVVVKPIVKKAVVAPKKVELKKPVVVAKVVAKKAEPVKPVVVEKVVAKKPEPVKPVVVEKVVAKVTPKNPKDIKIIPAKPVVLPKINTKTTRKYQPDFMKSVLDQYKNDPGAPIVKYSDAELQEFKDLILRKNEAAKKELSFLQGLISRKDDMGGDESENRYMTMEDGSQSMEREQLSQMASRQITFIDHLEKALMRIENKTYGVCRVTGKLIDKARLRAVPHATLSIEAKMGIVK